MTIFAPADDMHRLAKRDMDRGAAQSRAEAEATLRNYRVALSIDDDAARDRDHQAALLTAVALGRRVFLGGIYVVGALDVPLLAPLPLQGNLREAVMALGGAEASGVGDLPVISIGGKPSARVGGFHVRAVFGGWRGGIVPAHFDTRFHGKDVMALAPMLAAALAINEAFIHVSGEMPAAGHRATGLSLWNPSSEIDWLDRNAEEPLPNFLPSRLWLIGLGHLGQAYLWALGLLPYPHPAGVKFVLQDDDIVTPSTESTSILTEASMIGQRKTRTTAAWAERRGFEAVITERLFDAKLNRRGDEPGIALCGIDNAAGRRALDQVGFDFVVEAGLGREHRDFRSILIHTLPGARSAAELWMETEQLGTPKDQAAYRRMMVEGVLDQCGVTLLAGKAVGAPFVGAVAATLVIAEVLRLLNGGPLYRLVDLNLLSLEHRRAVTQQHDFGHLNPGFVTAAKR